MRVYTSTSFQLWSGVHPLMSISYFIRKPQWSVLAGLWSKMFSVHILVIFYKGARRAPFWKKGGRRAPWYLRCLAKSAIFGPTFSSGPPNGPPHRLTGEKCSFWPYFDSGPPNGPPYRLTGEKCTFWPYFVIGPPNGPPYRLTSEKCTFWPFSSGPPNDPPLAI